MADEKVTATEDSGENFAEMFKASQENAQGRVKQGDKVTGTVIDVTDDSVFVNVGVKIDGIMDRKDFIDNEGNLTVKVGDEVEAYVTKATSQEIVLSRSMNGAGMAAIENAKDAGIPVEGRVIDACKGGYHVEILGKIAFCPGSQMAAGEPESLPGQTFQFLITRVESRGRNIVVSHRALVDREREASLEKFLSEVKEGDIIEGKVTRLAPFGAFFEVAPAVEGMIHLSELSWSRVVKADEAVSVGQEVKVKLLKVSKEKGRDGREHTRISLSLKQAQGNPWDDAASKLVIGDIVEGRVVRLAPFGAFVEVLPGIEGLVHISEMSWGRRVNKPEEVVKPGDTVKVKIKDVDLENHRVSLSMRDAEGDPWADVETRFPVGASVTGKVENHSKFGLFVTLAPGITGLLPEGVMRATKTAAQFQNLEKDAEVELEIQRVDPAARRITLAPKGVEMPAPKEQEASSGKPERKGGRPGREPEDNSWRQHQKSGSSNNSVMFQALQEALKAKKN